MSTELMHDDTTYKIIPSDPSSTIQQKANILVNTLKTLKMFNNKELKSLLMNNCNVQRFILKYKTYTHNRPIAPNSKIAKLITYYSH